MDISLPKRRVNPRDHFGLMGDQRYPNFKFPDDLGPEWVYEPPPPPPDNLFNLEVFRRN